MYRFEPPPVAAPKLAISGKGWRIAAEMVIDVNLKGVRIAVPLGVCPAFARSDEVLATIEAPGLAGSAEIRSRIAFVADGGGRRVLALEFMDTPDLTDRATAEFFCVFNRREDRRQGAGAAATVEALVLDAEGQPDGVIDLCVLNRSPKGIGFVVDGATDAFMRDHDTVAIKLPAPGADERAARVRHRADRDDSVYYGCTLA
jgi:hypothetical protein